MVISPEVPLNATAFPTLPVVQVTPLESVPVLLLPEESAVVVPVPSSNEYAATRPDCGLKVTVLSVLVEAVLGFPARSLAAPAGMEAVTDNTVTFSPQS